MLTLWPVKTAEELGNVTIRITEAVAECPFKKRRKGHLLSLPLIIKCIIRDLYYREEQMKQTFDFYAADVSGKIKVSKDHHVLERLWQQQLM